MATLSPPYLHFNGNCEEAFTFYKSVFNSDFTGLMRYKDEPSAQPASEADGDKILNISLPIGPTSALMGSDFPAAFGKAIIGTNYYVYVNADSETEAAELFNGLSAGGQVMMPLHNTFWGSYFGMFTDKFGVQWMVSYEQNRN